MIKQEQTGERIEDRMRRECIDERPDFVPVYNIHDFIREIEIKAGELVGRKIKPKIIVVKSWGYGCIANYISDGKTGSAKYIEDTGSKVVYEFMGMQVVNISKPREDNMIKIEHMNFVEVYGA